MNSAHPQSALREWRAHMTHPARAAGLLGLSVILTVAGPFDTDTLLPPLWRFGYWVVLVFVTYSLGYAANGWATALAGDGAPLFKRAGLGAILTSLLVFAFVYVLNGFVLGHWATGMSFWAGLFNVSVIASIIAVVFHMLDETPQTPDYSRPSAALLDRLPLDKRGDLVSLWVQDHYVEVHTTKGSHLVLMRLTDAIRETEPVPGLQVHRSHWVALDQITAARRKGDGAILSLSHGPDTPVSRSNLQKVKEAGLLPR